MTLSNETIQLIKETASLMIFFAYLFFMGARVLFEFHKREMRDESKFISRRP